VSTLNFPIFCDTKEKRQLLRLVSDIYLRTEDPENNRTDFEYIERNTTTAIYAKVEGRITIIVLASIKMSNKEIKAAADKILKRVEEDELQYFITKY